MSGEPILVVDDDPQHLKLTRILLTRAGYRVRTAVHAEEALVVLHDFAPALILTDLQLPGMDGLELTRRLKADPAYDRVPILGLSGNAMHGDREKSLAAGCDDYVTKPIDTDGLPVTIAEHLARRA